MRPDYDPFLDVTAGEFQLSGSTILVRSPEHGEQNVSDFLSLIEGKHVRISLHHLPPNPTDPRRPGFGTCLDLLSCKYGHQQSTKLFNLDTEGVLRLEESGSWSVGGVQLPFEEAMHGHLGRMVIYYELIRIESPCLDQSLEEAERLSKVLDSLLGIVRKRGQ